MFGLCDKYGCDWLEVVCVCVIEVGDLSYCIIKGIFVVGIEYVVNELIISSLVSIVGVFLCGFE